MKYIYITDNNLEKRQKYNYSQYGGDAFLKSYFESRKNTIEQLRDKSIVHQTYAELKSIKNRLLTAKIIDTELKKEIDAYVKTFEVRKRLYSGYDQYWKPVCETYNDYNNYVMLAQILINIYEISHNIKYFSCLMKLDDTLISLIPIAPQSIRTEIKSILETEITKYELYRATIEEE